MALSLLIVQIKIKLVGFSFFFKPPLKVHRCSRLIKALHIWETVRKCRLKYEWSVWRCLKQLVSSEAPTKHRGTASPLHGCRCLPARVRLCCRAATLEKENGAETKSTTPKPSLSGANFTTKAHPTNNPNTTN